MKLVIGALVIWLTMNYARDNHISGSPSLSVLLIAFSACVFLLGVALINERNVFRVLVNWCIIAVFTGGGWLFGDFMSPTHVTHFGRADLWFARFVCAMIGAPIGYVVCLIIQQVLTKPVTDLEEGGSESDQYVDMAHD